MKIQHAGPLAALLLVSSIVTVIASEIPGRNEYAYGFELATSGDSNFFSVAVPIEVYRSVSDPRLRDAGVYNADGQPVPRIFEPSRAPDTDIEQKITLGLIPLYGQQAEQVEQLRLLLHQDAGGTRLELNEPTTGSKQTDDGVDAAQDGGRILTAYIADVHELEQALVTLTFDWQQQPEGFIGNVIVETGDDLQHWRKLGSASLAELEYENNRIEHKIVKTVTRQADYLRITWRDMPSDWSLKSVTGSYTEKGAPAIREWLTLDPVQPQETSEEYLFDIRGYPPVDRVNVILPDENMVLRASIFHRLSGEDNWRLSHNGIVYNIAREGNTLKAPVATVSDIRANEWKVRIESGVTTGPVRLQLGWRPEHLVFLAQGSPPYHLVTGRAHDRLEHYPQERLLGDRSIFSTLKQTGQSGLATLGPRMTLAGPDQMQIAVTSRWRVLLLWTGLTGAIVLVGWLVFSLMREMKQS